MTEIAMKTLSTQGYFLLNILIFLWFQLKGMPQGIAQVTVQLKTYLQGYIKRCKAVFIKWCLLKCFKIGLIQVKHKTHILESVL